MNKIEIRNFLAENSPDIILAWYSHVATPEEKLYAASIMRQVINLPIAETEIPKNLFNIDNTAVATTGTIMGIS